MRRRLIEAAVVVPALVVALAVAATAMSGFGGDTAFIYRQENARPLQATQLEEALLTTPEPYLDNPRDAVNARCRGGRSGVLRNPWRCVVDYRFGRSARFVVTLGNDGSFDAVHLDGSGHVTGCCIELAPTS
jgi:hypothetical protein